MSLHRATASLEKAASGFQRVLEAHDDLKYTKNVTDLDAIDGSGWFDFDGDAQNNPRPGSDGRVLQLEQENGEASQQLWFSDLAVGSRDRDKPRGHAEHAWGPLVLSYVAPIFAIVDDTTDAFQPAWLISANMFGDTDVSITNYQVQFTRNGPVVHASGFFDIEGFTVDIPTDSSWSADIDLGAIGVLAGVFTNIEDEPYAASTMRFDAPGVDTMAQAIYGRVRNKLASNPNSISFSSGQTDTGTAGGAATVSVVEGRARFISTFQVSD